VKKLLIVLLLLGVAAGGVGYWRGWFDFKKTDTNEGKTNVGVTADKVKLKAPVTRTESQTVSPTVVQFLLTAAATDFHTHRSPVPARFRDVCTFRDFLIPEPLKTSEKCSQSGNNGCFRRPLIPSRIGERPENPRKSASSSGRKSRKVQNYDWDHRRMAGLSKQPFHSGEDEKTLSAVRIISTSCTSLA